MCVFSLVSNDSTVNSNMIVVVYLLELFVSACEVGLCAFCEFTASRLVVPCGCRLLVACLCCQYMDLWTFCEFTACKVCGLCMQCGYSIISLHARCGTFVGDVAAIRA